MSVDGLDTDGIPHRKQLEADLSSLGRVPPMPRGKGGSVTGTPTRGSQLTRRMSGSGLTEKIGITRIPDRAWTIALDYLELGEASGRAFVSAGAFFKLYYCS